MATIDEVSSDTTASSRGEARLNVAGDLGAVSFAAPRVQPIAIGTTKVRENLLEVFN